MREEFIKYYAVTDEKFDKNEFEKKVSKKEQM